MTTLAEDQLVEVRPIDPLAFSDWTGMLALIRRSFAYMDGIIDPPSSVHQLDLQRLAAKAQAEAGFLAVVDGGLAGCVFVAARPDHGYIGKLAVDPRRQGSGVGRALLRAAERFAHKNGLPALLLETRVELVANHLVFRRWGFEEVGRSAHPGYTRNTAITFRKDLRR